MTWLRASVLLIGALLAAGCTSASFEAPVKLGLSGGVKAAAPIVPAAMADSSDIGARAFVQHVIATLNHAQTTGDTSALSELIATDCQNCQGFVSSIDAVYRAGGTIEGGAFTVDKLTVRCYGDGSYEASGILEYDDISVRETAEAEVVTYSAGRDAMHWELRHDSTGWHITDWGSAG